MGDSLLHISFSATFVITFIRSTSQSVSKDKHQSPSLKTMNLSYLASFGRWPVLSSGKENFHILFGRSVKLTRTYVFCLLVLELRGRSVVGTANTLVTD